MTDEELKADSAKSMMQQIGFGTDDQRIQLLLRPTPRAAIYRRKGRGGKDFDYVKGSWVKEQLNIIFLFQWDFELLPMENGQYYHLTNRQVLVMGKLTIKDLAGKARLVKMGLGKKDMAYTKDTAGNTSSTPVDVGNDIKAAETDSLKRCAVQLGIGLDLYKKGND